MSNKESPIPLSAMNTVQHTVGDHTFIFAVPTQLMKERLGLRLYELGVTQVTPAQLRAVTVNELFEIMPEDEAEEAADELHGYWTAEDEHVLAMDRWRQREVQRVIDFTEGAPKRDPEAQPVSDIKPRTRYRVQALMDRVNDNSRRYREVQARRLDFTNANARMMLRLAIVGCKSKDITLEHEETDQVLTEASLEAIRTAVGPDGVQELVAFVNGQYGISEEERENSVSPGESASDQTGSTGESGASESSIGNSKQPIPTTEIPPSASSPSGITPARGAASATTTGKSSGTSSGTAGRKRKSGRTAVAG